MFIKSNFKKLREKNNLTQLELAKVLKISTKTIQAFESDECFPDGLTLIKLSLIFQAEPSKLAITAQEIDNETASEIIETGKPLGLFILEDLSIDKTEKVWIGIDNSMGFPFVDEFKTLKECINYLKGSD